MFQPQMKNHDVFVSVVTENEYHEKVKTYEKDRTIKLAFCVDNLATYQANDQDVINVRYAGITRDRKIKKGDRIDNIYSVDYVEVYRLYTIVHLTEIDNGGQV